jgi:hypothetical protein
VWSGLQHPAPQAARRQHLLQRTQAALAARSAGAPAPRRPPATNDRRAAARPAHPTDRRPARPPPGPGRQDRAAPEGSGAGERVGLTGGGRVGTPGVGGGPWVGRAAAVITERRATCWAGVFSRENKRAGSVEALVLTSAVRNGPRPHGRTRRPLTNSRHPLPTPGEAEAANIPCHGACPRGASGACPPRNPPRPSPALRTRSTARTPPSGRSSSSFGEAGTRSWRRSPTLTAATPPS